jgi:hypothetical protein
MWCDWHPPHSSYRFRIIWTHQFICPSWTNGLYVHWFIIYIFQRFGLKVWNRVENTCKYRRLCNIGHMWGLSSLFFFCYSVWWIGSNFWTNLMDFRASLRQLLCKSVFNMWNIIVFNDNLSNINSRLNIFLVRLNI